MKYSFQFSNLIGTVYNQGNLVFSPDGNVLFSPVGNKVTLFDLKSNKSETLPLESRYSFKSLSLSPNGHLLIALDEGGETYLLNVMTRRILHQLQMGRRTSFISFSPDGKYILFARNNASLVYRAPDAHIKQYTPFALERIFQKSYDDVQCFSWTSDSCVFAVGALDGNTHVIPLKRCSNMLVQCLGTHGDSVVGCHFEKNSLDLITVGRNGSVFLWQCDLELSDLKLSHDSEEPLEKRRKAEESEDEMGSDEEKAEKALEEPDKPKRKVYKRTLVYHASDLVKDAGGKKIYDSTLTATAYHAENHILVLGFSTGAFFLLEMPEANLIHSLSMPHEVSTININKSGDWIALASKIRGQLVVWEWQSESYILKQEGHINNMTCVSYSPDGQFIASGGEDSRLKLWHTSSGFCFVTFTDHAAPVTGVSFTSNGKAVLSASLDGTVRAFDLARYRNFRTFTSPTPVQFSCIAVDPSSELVAAGTQDTFDTYVWSMKTGRLLEVLAGHEGPVAGVAFNPMPTETLMASCSWDKTVKLWDVVTSATARETITLTSDGLCVTFRPDGKELAVATLDGNIYFFEPLHATQVGSIEGRYDLGSGRKDTDMISAKKSMQGKAFTTLCYSADGECILAAGQSKYICLYHIKEGVLLRKFMVTQNLSFDSMNEFVNRRKMTEFGNLSLVEDRGEGEKVAIALPGVKKGDMATRTFRPEVRVTSIRYAPTGRCFIATTTEGILIFSLDARLNFQPYQLDETVTPTAVHKALHNEEFGMALILAFRLNEFRLIQEVIESTPVKDVEVIASGLPLDFVMKMLSFSATQLERSSHVEFYLIWIQSLLYCHGMVLKSGSSDLIPVLRSLQRNLSIKREEIGKICDHNKFLMKYLHALHILKKEKNQDKPNEVMEDHDNIMEIEAI